MERNQVFGTGLLLFVVLALWGCASTQPNVETEQPEPPPVAPEDTMEAPAAGDVAVPTSSDPMANSLKAHPQDEMVVVDDDVVPSDEIEVLPEEALPMREQDRPFVTLDEDRMAGGVDSLEPELVEKKILLSEGPLPPGPEPVQPIDGWRVQVASVKYENSTEPVLDSLAGVTEAEPHIMWRDGMYKVQVGDFTTMEQADALRRELHQEGFPDAFLVATTVRPTATDTATVADGEASPASEPATTDMSQQRDGWRIQIMSVSSMDNAQKARQEARRKLGMPVYIAEIGGMFKLRAGDFSTRSEADKAKEKAEQMGYKGAFPVRSKIR